jgi:hypothetical protein
VKAYRSLSLPRHAAINYQNVPKAASLLVRAVWPAPRTVWWHPPRT